MLYKNFDMLLNKDLHFDGLYVFLYIEPFSDLWLLNY
jgi:hypothetical protein